MIIDISELSQTLMERVNKVKQNVVDESVAQMKTLAPVNTGALRDSIGVEENGNTVTIGASTEYAPFVELGTENTDPNPFVRPTVDSIDAIIKRAIEK